tara:strand:+ start:783 stop:1880 length:1098 start_codon:yes stop_codon:yes gene_type:complete
MKIAIITPVYSIAGVPLAQHRFARALASKNFKVDLIIGFLPTDLHPPEIPGVSINILNKNNVRKMFFKLISIFKREKYDLIFSAEDHLNIVVIFAKYFSYSNSLISASSRVTPYDTYSNNLFSKGWILKQLTKLTMKKADVLSCVSKDMVKQYKSIFKSSTHQCIYNIVDDTESREKMHEHLEHPWINRDKYSIIIASGRLAEWKGFEDLIRAMPLILKEQNVKLIILGDGPLKSHLKSVIGELNLNSFVDLAGYVDNPFKYYKNSDVFVLSSYVEGLPNVLVEAMMCGCTPVSTDCPTGPSEVLQRGKYGYLVPMHNPRMLAQGVIRALKSPIPKILLDEAIKPFNSDEVLKSHFKALNLTSVI